jgi:hypothetical protein
MLVAWFNANASRKQTSRKPIYQGGLPISLLLPRERDCDNVYAAEGTAVFGF